MANGTGEGCHTYGLQEVHYDGELAALLRQISAHDRNVKRLILRARGWLHRQGDHFLSDVSQLHFDRRKVVYETGAPDLTGGGAPA
jgi:hypothetical protein